MASQIRLSSKRPTLLRTKPVIAYTRKSREQADFQVNSLERQRDAITLFARTRNLGVVDQWFDDEQSGKNFRRPGYDALMAFCESHPQPRKALGMVICYDYDRFSRPVDEFLKVDQLEYQRQVIRLRDAGWHLEYVQTPNSGNAMLDGITTTLKASMAGEFLEKLSLSIKGGKMKSGHQGGWIGGAAPFPTVRYNDDDPTFKRPLQHRDYARNGRCILGPNVEHPEYRTYWEEGARMLLRGEPFLAVARQFEAWGIPTARNSRFGWSSTHMIVIFTNVALIGKVQYTFSDDQQREQSYVGDAKWGPLVDEDLFWRVQQEVMHRRSTRRVAMKKSTEFILNLQCYHCLNFFYGGVKPRKRDGARIRRYCHPSANSRLPLEARTRLETAGCRCWQLDAPAIEDAVRDVIAEMRLSDAFYQQVLDLMDRHDDQTTSSQHLEEAALQNVRSLDGQKQNLKMALRFAESDAERTELMSDIRKLTTQLDEATHRAEQARLQAQQSRNGTGSLVSVISDAQALLNLWDDPGPNGVEARKRLVDLWVAGVYVEVLNNSEKPNGRKHPMNLHIFLTADPTNPIKVQIDPKADYSDIVTEKQHAGEKNITNLPRPPRIY